MQVILVMFRAEGERRSFSVSRDVTVIGRREDCDLRIPVSDVSRKHCRLIKEGDTLRIEDLGSSNGTFHNGQRVQEATLQAGDSVQVGPVVFVVQIDGVPADEQMQPFEVQAAHQLEETAPQAGAEAGSHSEEAAAEALDTPEGSEEQGFEIVPEDDDAAAIPLEPLSEPETAEPDPL